MKKLSKLLSLIIVLTACFSIPFTAYAHPGRTDSNGGHTDQSTGEYHYHHGYPAHDHYDMDGDGDIDCPYDFDNKTSHKDSSPSSGSTGTSDNASGFLLQNKTAEKGGGIIVNIWIVVAIVLAFLFIVWFMRNEIKSLETNNAQKAKCHADELASEKDSVHKSLTSINNDFVHVYGSDYLYSISNAPSGEYLDADNLPVTTPSSQFRWGEKYTFFCSSYAYESGRKFHLRNCRYAKYAFPVNAYSIYSKRYNYQPCSVCKPELPDMKWVSKYLEHKSFFDKYNIEIPKPDQSGLTDLSDTAHSN